MDEEKLAELKRVLELLAERAEAHERANRTFTAPEIQRADPRYGAVELAVFGQLVAQSLDDPIELCPHLPHKYCKVKYDGNPNSYHKCKDHPDGVVVIWER